MYIWTITSDYRLINIPSEDTVKYNLLKVKWKGIDVHVTALTPESVIKDCKKTLTEELDRAETTVASIKDLLRRIE